MLQDERRKDFPHISKKARTSNLTTSSQHCTGNPATAQGNNNNKEYMLEGRNKVCLFTGNVILYIENPKNLKKKEKLQK